MPIIKGYVHGPSSRQYPQGIPVENASVTVRSKNFAKMVLSNYQGTFQVNVPSGRYTIRFVQRDYLVPEILTTDVYDDIYVDAPMPPDPRRRKF